MKRRRISIKKIALFLIVLIILAFVCFLGLYDYKTSPVSDSTDAITVEVEEGDNYFTMASKLKESDLIKSEFFYKVFLKMHKPGELTVGFYDLNQSMGVSEIVETLGNEENVSNTKVKLTFREGLNIRQMAEIVEEKTDITEGEFINKVNDENYIDTLISEYWFLTDDIKNEEIYYDLEGYLYPDTYIFEHDDLTLELLIETILNNTQSKLEDLKDSILASDYSVHELITLASIVELEAVTDSDRALVAGVFYNRLNNGWSLGSDVTTYYATKKEMSESLTTSDLNDCNAYNTRCTSMKTLPVGPIDNPSLSSITAAVNPTESDYYYFVADSEKQVHFTKNATEHAEVIAELKEAGKWIG